MWLLKKRDHKKKEGHIIAGESVEVDPLCDKLMNTLTPSQQREVGVVCLRRLLCFSSVLVLLSVYSEETLSSYLRRISTESL